MALPTSKEEYEARWMSNLRVLPGHGGEQMVHLPCPFCGGRDWLELPVTEARHSTSAIYCTECDRSAAIEFREAHVVADRFREHSHQPFPTEWNLIQVAGPPADPWVSEWWPGAVRDEGQEEEIRSRGRLEPHRPNPRPTRKLR